MCREYTPAHAGTLSIHCGLPLCPTLGRIEDSSNNCRIATTSAFFPLCWENCYIAVLSSASLATFLSLFLPQATTFFIFSLSRPSRKSTGLKGWPPQSNSTRSSYGEWVNNGILFSDPLVVVDISSSPSTGSDGRIAASSVTKGMRSVASALSGTLVHLFTNPGRILDGNTCLYDHRL